MDMKIVADSSANLPRLEGANFSAVPLKIVNDQREYTDDEHLDVEAMVEELSQYRGRTGTACPSVGEWLEAFGEAEGVFTVAITSSLSGAHNAAVQAAQVYQEKHPDRRVCCLDTLSTGPEMVLIAEKLRDLISAGLPFDDIREKIRAYMEKTHLLFFLESVDNLAKNGRVSPLIAKAVGFLGIRIVGKASSQGTLQQLHKCRGENKGLEAMLGEMEGLGFRGGKVRVAHVLCPDLGQRLRELVEARWPGSDVMVTPAGGLCSFYAERGGVLVGFEEM